jgi:hypothetical protein
MTDVVLLRGATLKLRTIIHPCATSKPGSLLLLDRLRHVFAGTPATRAFAPGGRSTTTSSCDPTSIGAKCLRVAVSF